MISFYLLSSNFHNEVETNDMHVHGSVSLSWGKAHHLSNFIKGNKGARKHDHAKRYMLTAFHFKSMARFYTLCQPQTLPGFDSLNLFLNNFISFQFCWFLTDA